MNSQVKNNTFSISDAPKLLQFNSEAPALHQALKQQFHALVKSKIQEFVDTAREEAPFLVKQFETKMSGFNASEQEHIVSIPPFLGQVFRYKNKCAPDKIKFWLEIIDRHIAHRDKDFSNLDVPAFWTLDGAIFMRDQGDEEHVLFEAPKLYDQIILDFFSEVNASLDSGDYLSFDADDEMVDYSFEEAESLIEHLEKSLEPANSSAISLLTNFTHVVHFRKSTGAASSTSSSTNGGFIGRVLIGNAHLYQPELFADAMVHEATHGVLFMINELEEWMPGTKEHNANHYNITSPWTGNFLSPRNLFQACFVWYGLFQFFLSHQTKYSNTQVVTDRMTLIQKGFQDLPLDSLLQDRFPETFNTIQQMKTEVSGHIIA